MPLIAQYQPKQIKLQKVPEDVYCILLQEQSRIKKEKGKGMFGFEQTIYAIIREHKRCEENK